MRRRFQDVIRRAKQPRILWGYEDSNNEWRPRTRISDTAYIYCPERIRIADNVFIGHYTILDGTGTMAIEEGCQISAWVGIFTHSSHISIRLYGQHYQEIPEDEKKGYNAKPVSIGKYTYVGAGARIMPGVRVGKGVIISSNAIVTKHVRDFSVISGINNVVGDTRDVDKPYLDDLQLLKSYEEWQKK